MEINTTSARIKRPRRNQRLRNESLELAKGIPVINYLSKRGMLAVSLLGQ
jgi:hypothetical protein